MNKRQSDRIKQSLDFVKDFSTKLDLALVGLSDNISYGEISSNKEIFAELNKIQDNHYKTLQLVESLTKKFVHANL